MHLGVVKMVSLDQLLNHNEISAFRLLGSGCAQSGSLESPCHGSAPLIAPVLNLLLPFSSVPQSPVSLHLLMPRSHLWQR